MDVTNDKKSGNQHSQRREYKQRKKLPHKERWTAEKSDMQYHGSKFHSAEW